MGNEKNDVNGYDPETDAKNAYSEVKKRLKDNSIAQDALEFLEHDEYIQGLIDHANNVAINRFHYNDHGLTHSRIATRNALTILELLNKKGIQPNTVREMTGTYEDAQLVVLVATYLHDVGNGIHREMHYHHGILLLGNVIDALLFRYYQPRKAARLKASIFECIYTHDEAVPCISIEGGCVTVGDGTDMANGRARVPFSKGKVDIHSVSALAIKKVKIREGVEKPVRIEIEMTCSAGLFQIQEVLGPKIRTSGIENYLEVIGTVEAKERERFFEKIEFEKNVAYR
ncbi:MAG: HD domain-containing protein [Thermoplasmata archaeon]